MEATRIDVEPEGTAIVLRTPFGRSARFRSLGDAVKWHEGNSAGVLPMLVAGGVATVAKFVVPEDAFMVALAIVITAGMIVSIVVSTRARRGLPEPSWLSWEESVRADDREHPPLRALEDLGGAVASGLLLALVLFLLSENHRRIVEEGIFALVMAGVFTLALMVGVALGAYSAIQRVRFRVTRCALERAARAER